LKKETRPRIGLMPTNTSKKKGGGKAMCYEVSPSFAVRSLLRKKRERKRIQVYPCSSSEK